MDVRSLEIFLAIAEEGSIHAGARRAFIAQPSASKYLRKLEQQLRTELVTRSPQGIELTVAGRVLMDEAKQILSRLQRLSNLISDATEKEPLVVGLMSGSFAAGDFTFDILKHFRRQYPNINVLVRELSFANQYAAVRNGNVDLAIVRAPSERDDLTMDALFAEPRVLCVREDSEYADLGQVSAEDVIDKVFVSVAESPSDFASFWYLDDMRNGPACVTTDVTTTVAELQYALLAGDGVLPIAQSAWQMGLAHRDLRAIAMIDTPASEVAVAYVDTHRRDEVEAFVESARATVHLLGRPADETDDGLLLVGGGRSPAVGTQLRDCLSAAGCRRETITS
jgi:molybdate transport repressor ModE-like protein